MVAIVYHLPCHEFAIHRKCHHLQQNLQASWEERGHELGPQSDQHPDRLELVKGTFPTKFIPTEKFTHWKIST